MPGLNRLLSNNSYEAAFPLHEVSSSKKKSQLLHNFCHLSLARTAFLVIFGVINFNYYRQTIENCVFFSKSGEVPQQKLRKNTRSREPPTPAVRVLGLVGGLVQVSTAGPHQVKPYGCFVGGLNVAFKIRIGVIVSHPRVLKLLYKIQYLSDCVKPVLLFQEVFWREDRSVFRLARLVHGDAVSCSSGWSRGVPVWRLYPGALPGQVNTTSSKSHTVISVFSSIAATYKNNQRDTYDVSLLDFFQPSASISALLPWQHIH